MKQNNNQKIKINFQSFVRIVYEMPMNFANRFLNSQSRQVSMQKSSLTVKP